MILMQRFCVSIFLSTLSLRRATTLHTAHLMELLFLSTLSLRRATDWPPVREIVQWISIHALLAESDLKQSSSYSAYLEISIHALLAESDDNAGRSQADATNFYPRSPCGERPKRFCDPLEHLHFYPRSPCGERLDKIPD